MGCVQTPPKIKNNPSGISNTYFEIKIGGKGYILGHIDSEKQCAVLHGIQALLDSHGVQSLIRFENTKQTVSNTFINYDPNQSNLLMSPTEPIMSPTTSLLMNKTRNHAHVLSETIFDTEPELPTSPDSILIDKTTEDMIQKEMLLQHQVTLDSLDMMQEHFNRTGELPISPIQQNPPCLRDINSNESSDSSLYRKS